MLLIVAWRSVIIGRAAAAVAAVVRVHVAAGAIVIVVAAVWGASVVTVDVGSVLPHVPIHILISL